MTKPTGRWIAMSPFRRIVDDLMHFSILVPAVTADRRMNLAPLMAARAASPVRPSWSVLFSKAYGMLSRDHPVLRRCYLKFPWAHLHEHPHSVAALNVERRLNDEDVILFCLVRAPENRTLEEMEAMLQHHKTAPVETLRAHQRTMRLAYLPWPLRQWFWWAALNTSGRRRCHNFGTFSVSSTASSGAGLLTVVPVLSSSLHYGQFDGTRLDVRITFDHRVMDGAMVARAMADLEGILTHEMVREVEGSRSRLAAA